ncbi:MAG TPA: S46 family peptidase [Bacteroidia bacterium]|nr:S46 family peptidase [Bacteroidia bacterium]
MKKFFLVTGLLILTGIHVIASPDEGMWLPMLIKRLNAEDMAKHGCKLTAEEIYQVNQTALKDAIVSLEFCTAEIVSENGLLFTNHHCAYSAIQENSSVAHNYLDDGFWAKSYSEELKIPGQTASILVRMEDVTSDVLKGIDENTSAADRSKMVADATKEISKKAAEEGKYKAVVKDMFNGNEYYLFVYETFKDVRLVGAPPQSIGKFGGDTDNWMWPRHTGDFSLLRIYANKENKPVEYSPENVPYKAKHVIPVSLKGYNEGDFAMIMGFPGRTNRYITSPAMELQMQYINPVQIKLFGKKLETWKKDMNADTKVRIQYSAKYAKLANSWKYYIGQNEGLERLGVIAERKKEEAAFTAWAKSSESNKKYADILTEYTNAVDGYKDLIAQLFYLNMAGKSCEAAQMIRQLNSVKEEVSKKTLDPKALDASMKDAKKAGEEFYKDYNTQTDFNVVCEMLKLYLNDISVSKLPPAIAKIANGKGKNNEEKIKNWATKLFEKSIFTSEEKYKKWLSKPNAKSFDKDPLVIFTNELNQFSSATINPAQQKYNSQTDRLKRIYLEGLMKFEKDNKFYPDANSTERLTYGNVKAYAPKDAVSFKYYTTTEGILQKASKDKNSDFYVPEGLIELIKKKDFGPYAENGELKVAFLTNNDITGGNSGSPVMNDKGELIGIAFDGNWEAMTGDLVFDPELKRTICVDIRYVLFIMDKYAGAKNLVNEMKLTK